MLAIAGLFFGFISHSAWAQQCVPITAGEPEDRVVGGNRASIDEWPSFASISIRPTDSSLPDIHICGATAIASDWLLTAAHCVYGYEGEEDSNASDEVRIGPGIRHTMAGISGRLYATLGTDHLNEDDRASVIAIEKVIIHENYAPGAVRENDIALLKLSESWSGAIGRLGLTSSYAELSGRAFVAGFGFTLDPRDRDADEEIMLGGMSVSQRSNGSSYLSGSERLLAALVPPVDDRTCIRSNPGSIDRQTEFCAGFRTGSRDSCNTDSGGPIVQIDKEGCPYLVGIVQSGRWCGAEDNNEATYGIYTRLSAFADFISTHVTGFQLPVSAPETDHQRMLAAAEKLEKWSALIPDRVDVRMHRLARPGVGESELGVDPNSFIEGDGMFITFKSDIPGQVSIVDMNANGTLTEIYSRSIELVADGSVEGRIPSGDEPFKAEGPFGEGRLLMVVSPDWAAMDFTNNTSNSDDMSNLILDQIGYSLSDERNSDNFEGWGMTIVPYAIAPRNYGAAE